MSSNLVVLSGDISGTVTWRELASGPVAQFDVKTSTSTVPVVWYDPPGSTDPRMQVGAHVVLVGAVQRRFFRSGGLTQSRTEVAVERMTLARRRATVRSLIADAAQRVSRVGERPGPSAASA